MFKNSLWLSIDFFIFYRKCEKELSFERGSIKKNSFWKRQFVWRNVKVSFVVVYAVQLGKLQIFIWAPIRWSLSDALYGITSVCQVRREHTHTPKMGFSKRYSNLNMFIIPIRSLWLVRPPTPTTRRYLKRTASKSQSCHISEDEIILDYKEILFVAPFLHNYLQPK